MTAARDIHEHHDDAHVGPRRRRGRAIELIVQLDPWSAGLVDTIDPIVGRTLFWWTGHPIVYFWLMPAYVSWYGLLSKQCRRQNSCPTPWRG